MTWMWGLTEWEKVSRLEADLLEMTKGGEAALI